jgi:lipopolysaccharide export LptBFGC system permease protein LptF
MIKYQDKFAMPIASIVFALFSLSMGMYTARSGRGEGLGISIIIMLLYYGSKIATENLITKANLSPYLTWAPNVLFFSVGLILIINKVRK